MVKLQRKNAQNIQPTLTEIAKDPAFIKASKIIERAERNGRKLGFYEPE